jgi:hypothetical protein
MCNFLGADHFNPDNANISSIASIENYDEIMMELLKKRLGKIS